MALPDASTLECQIGYTWTQEFLYFDDAADTVEHDFTGYTLHFKVIHQSGAVTVASVNVTGNAVLASLTNAVTSAFHEETAKYILWMVNDSDATDSSPLGAGNFEIVEVV